MGHLIPAGTGFDKHRQVELVELGEPIPEAASEDDEILRPALA